MEAIVKGLVSDHWSTVIYTVTYIGFGFKNSANLGFAQYVFLEVGEFHREIPQGQSLSLLKRFFNRFGNVWKP